MLTPVNDAWIKKFGASHARRPRILHIGNIANNAYLNAKFLNEHGFDCDVICYDYYHIMGCPEWEDAEFDHCYPESQSNPNWVKAGLKGFERPKWFVQGPQSLCLDYLLARRKGETTSVEEIWKELGAINRTIEGPGEANHAKRKRQFLHIARRLNGYRHALFRAPDLRSMLRSKVRERAGGIGGAASFLSFLAVPLIELVALGVALAKKWTPYCDPGALETEEKALLGSFEKFFPNRPAVFEHGLSGYADTLPRWRELLDHYDVVVGYATDGIYPLLSGKKPYVAFEHGTIRNIPFVDDIQGQLCALTYRSASAVVITNADNILAAEKLGLATHRFIPHPINDMVIGSNFCANEYEKLHHDLDADFVVFHPSRQHWEDRRHPDWEKGNDFFLRGFSRFLAETNNDAAVVLVRWGASVAASEKLIRKLGITDRVRWIEPLPHRAMMRMILACDAVADQFYLGAFGSTMPKSLACGKPALLHLDEAIHHWCFPEMPPVVNVQSEDEIFEGLSRLYLDKPYYLKLCTDAKNWYEKWHSSDVVTNRFADLFREIT